MESFLTDSCSYFESATQGENSAAKLVQRFQRVIIYYISDDNGPLSSIGKKVLTELVATLQSLCDVILLSGKEPVCVEQCANWWSKVCKEHAIEDSSCGKKLLEAHLKFAFVTDSRSESVFRSICEDLRIHLGTIDEEEEEEETSPSQQNISYKFLSGENVSVLLPLIVHHAEEVLHNMDWVLQCSKGRLLAHGDKKKDIQKSVLENEELTESRRRMEGLLCSRAYSVARGLTELAQTLVRSASAVDNFLKVFTAFFTFLNSLSKYYVWTYAQGIGNIPSKYEKLCNYVGADLMTLVYRFLLHADGAQTERLDSAKASKKKKNKENVPEQMSTLGKARVLKEGKGITNLVYAIEQHEHQLILLGKKAKVDFMRHHHLPTSRDFRIRGDVLKLAVAEQEANKRQRQTEEQDESEGNPNEEEDPYGYSSPSRSQSKRPRLSTDNS